MSLQFRESGSRGTQKLQLEFFLRVSEGATMFSEKHGEMCQQAIAISGVCTT